MSSIIAVRGIETTSAAFRHALYRGAVARGLNPDHLAAVISLESGFNPQAENSQSHALGLIQWVNDASFAATARRAGMPWLKRQNLRFMSAMQQLPLVFAWFDGIGKLTPSSRLVDYYLAVWGPAHIGKGDSTVLARDPDKAYVQNKGFDDDRKGYFTVSDVAREITKVRSSGLARGVVPADAPAVDIAALAVGGIVALAAYVALPRMPTARRWLASVG